MESGVSGKQIDQLVEVAVAGGGQKGRQKGLAVFGRCLVTGAMGVETPAGSPEDCRQLASLLSTIWAISP
jgi:hypothetical protein